MKISNKNITKQKRHWRIRKKIKGTALIPRMCVHRSLKYMYVQLIDDLDNKTLITCGTNSGEFQKRFSESKNNKKAAVALGELVAEKALSKGIKKVVFDRSGYKYHGRVQVLAENARKKGLQF